MARTLESHSTALRACGFAALGLILVLFGRRIGLAPQDVAIAFGVFGYATLQRRWERQRATLLGESGLPHKPVRWADFVRDNHLLTGCIVRGRRRRSHCVLALALSSLAVLYFKAIFRPPPVRLGSFAGLRSSLYTLLLSKVVQVGMKQAIRVQAGRAAAWQASTSWTESFSFSWMVFQYWVIGFMMLVVGLALRDGLFAWWPLLSGWLVRLLFAIGVMDLAVCYIRYTLYCAYLSRLKKRPVAE